MIGIRKRVSSGITRRMLRTLRRWLEANTRRVVSLVAMSAVVIGDFGVPLPLPTEGHQQPFAPGTAVVDAVSAMPRCGCAKAGTAACCCVGRAAVPGANSCCNAGAKTAAPQQIAANAQPTNAQPKSSDSPIPSFNACACGAGARPGLLLNSQPRLVTPARFDVCLAASAKLETGELAAHGHVRRAPEPPRPKSLCG